MHLFFDTPLWATAHLPHKGGDQPTLPLPRNLKPCMLSAYIDADVISPLVGEMSGRTEGGEYSSPRMH
ncbi:hypothetical protein DEV92_101260 [Phyllobacterium myrsinacearum]|nr:hypothetical protein DEV92_101260 [Phyllobacterium myrsinacearum]RZV09730.1 hypothetical protein EV654_0829 [Phyllobacterium myrsinacearum]